MVTGSIVTYNNSIDDLEKVISSFLKTSLNSKLYISDNSLSSEVEKLCSDPRVEYIKNERNLGFGRGHNIAIKKAINDGSIYHVILNPDIFFEDDVIEKLRKFMDKSREIGLVMPKVFYPNGEVQYLCKLLPDPLNLFGRRFLPKWKWLQKKDEKYEMRFTGYDKIIDCPYLSGCFMFIRTEIFKEIGMFDEKIFMYLEDTDLTRRIHRKYRTVMYPEVHIYHTWAKGSYRNIKLTLYNIRSAIYYFNKYGWIFDRERKKTNKNLLELYR